MNEFEIVELHPAFYWDCNACGRENFVRAILQEFTDEELKELRETEGIIPGETGNFQKRIEEVTCQFCKEDFRTNLYQTVSSISFSIYEDESLNVCSENAELLKDAEQYVRESVDLHNLENVNLNSLLIGFIRKSDLDMWLSEEPSTKHFSLELVGCEGEDYD